MRGRPSEEGDAHQSDNGYHYIRTESGWRLWHHVIAEEEVLHRPLKSGERVVFKDGNRNNLDADNLEIRLVGSTSQAAKIARLEAQRAEIDAQITELRGQ